MIFKRKQLPPEEPASHNQDNSEEEISLEKHAIPGADQSKSDAPWIDGDPEKKPGRSHVEAGRSIVAEADEVTEELEHIYDNDDEDEADMSRLDRGAGLRFRRWLIGMVAFFGFLALASWAGFFLFSPTGDKFTGDGVTLAIDGPPQVMSGQQVTYTVTVKNGESVPLGTANLDIRLPRQFVLNRTEPSVTVDDRLTWQIGSLSPGREKRFSLTGIYLAPLEAQLDTQAILNYRPADFNSLFQKVATRTVGVGGSVFQVEVLGPERVLPGDSITIDYSFLNTTDNEFRDLKVTAAWPEGFLPESAEPPALDDNLTEWAIAELPANSQGHVKVTGSFASDSKGKRDFGFEFGLIDEQGNFGLQSENDYSIQVVEGELVLSLVLNGKSGNQPANFGDMLRYSLSWQNTGQSALEDVELSVSLEALPAATVVDWNQLADDWEGDLQDGRLTWTSEAITALETIKSGDDGTLDFSLPLISAPLADNPNKDYRVAALAEARINKIDGAEVNRTVRTPALVAVLSSDAGFAGEARYFDSSGLPVGTGPMPPKVGEVTSYRVNWLIQNSLHDLADLKISARIPDNVIWTGKSEVDAGEVTFDAANSKIVWELNWLPTNVNQLLISFDVALTPTADQLGKSPTVIDAAILEARDRENNNPIILSTPPLTTALPDDELAAGKGKVE
jgi:hypothetical protein